MECFFFFFYIFHLFRWRKKQMFLSFILFGFALLFKKFWVKNVEKENYYCLWNYWNKKIDTSKTGSISLKWLNFLKRDNNNLLFFLFVLYMVFFPSRKIANFKIDIQALQMEIIRVSPSFVFHIKKNSPKIKSRIYKTEGLIFSFFFTLITEFSIWASVQNFLICKTTRIKLQR